MKAFIATALVMTLLLSAALVMAPGVRAATPRAGAYMDSITFFEQRNQAQALKDLEQNQMDMYEFELRTITDIRSAKADPNLNTVDVTGSLKDMFLNPVQVNKTACQCDKINPFADREVREAMNYLIDRKFISDQIFGGAVIPHTTLWWSQHPEFGRDPVYFAKEQAKYSSNPEKAKTMIANGMQRLGATFVNGQWMYKGSPVELKLVQRTEDARFDIGAYAADQLKAAGFQVTLIPKSGGGAFAIVYNGPPDTNTWNLYTEGWASSGLTAWADTDLDYYFNGGEGSRIWNAYKPSGFPAGSLEKQMADVSDKLFASKYKSLAERETLIEQAVDLSLKNSVRVWLVAGATFASSKRLPGPGLGYVYDLHAGPWAWYSTRTARFDQTGGALRVGQRLMFVSPWNPWRGFGWLYDILQLYDVYDPAIWINPQTGVNIPVRTSFQVTTAGPDGKLDVPSDAMLWNNTNTQFQSVGDGKKATSMVKLTFTFNKWHDGQAINMNDVLHEISLWGRFAKGGDIYPHDDDSQASGVRLFNQVARGIKVVGDNELDVYGEYWHVDQSTIASTLAGVTCGGNGCTSVFPVVPWDVAELSMAPILADKFKLSPDSADAAGVDALDLTKGNSLNSDTCTATSGTLECLDSAMAVYKAANHKAPGMGALISNQEATARWAALQDFRNAHGHYLVSNGPFFLDNVQTTPSSQTTMKRVSTESVGFEYPYSSDRWDSLLVPKVPTVQIDAPPQIILLPDVDTNIRVRTSIGDQPYDNLDLIWQLFNPGTGEFLFNGTAIKSAPGLWNVLMTADQTKDLPRGAYSLTVIALGKETAVPILATESFVAAPLLSIVDTFVSGKVATLQTDIKGLQNDLAAARQQTTNAQNQVNLLSAALVGAFAIAAISLILNFVNMRSFRRRIEEVRAPGGAMARPVQLEQEKP